MERGYRWIDNSPLDYVNWQSGEPSDYRVLENCVEMKTRSGQWNDVSCAYQREFMCKKKLGEKIVIFVVRILLLELKSKSKVIR